MGVGLLSLLVAENNRKRASAAAQSGERADEPMAAAPAVPEPKPARAHEASSYDRQAWRRLVESDADLARVTSVLADYGQQYVDELAGEYLAETDKDRLPAIVDGIVARASKGVAPRRHAAVDTTLPDSTGGSSNAGAHRPDRQPKLLPEETLKLSEKLPASAPRPVEPAKQETIGASVELPIAPESATDVGDRNKTIISADEELTAMLGRLAPDAATPSKS
ncbi:hypothetical protein LJR220_003732 [Bradyrhizobium sp. LjRoot220]|uniref:hypothetical protein n=1 Tax=Bradyrhizobium sp. LjRoot220 TaxID=3342284 RepID=UPI003ECEC273